MRRGIIALSCLAAIACLLWAPVSLSGAPNCAWAQAAAETATGFTVDGIGIGSSRDTVLGVLKEKYQIVREYIDHLANVGLIMGAPGKPEDYTSPERMAGYADGKLFIYAFYKESDLEPELPAQWVADFTSRFGQPSPTAPDFLTASGLWEDLQGMVAGEGTQANFWSIPENKLVLFTAYDAEGGEGGYFLVDVPVMDRNYALFTELTNMVF